MNTNTNFNVTSLFDFASKTIIDSIQQFNITAVEQLPLPTPLKKQLEPLFLNKLIYKDLLQRVIKFNYNYNYNYNYKSVSLDIFFSEGLAQITPELIYHSNEAKKYRTLNRTLFIVKLCEYMTNIDINQDIKEKNSVKIIQAYNATKGAYGDILEKIIEIAVYLSRTNITITNQLMILENLSSIIKDASPIMKFRLFFLEISLRVEIECNKAAKITIEDYNNIFKKDVMEM